MAFALLLADRSDFERAIEIASLAKGFPLVSNSVWFEDIASREIEAIAITMPSNTVNAARKRGSLRDVWETAEELLDMDSVIHPQIADQV